MLVDGRIETNRDAVDADSPGGTRYRDIFPFDDSKPAKDGGKVARISSDRYDEVKRIAGN